MKKSASRVRPFSSHIRKKGDMNISFGMIFSIIMIIIFVTFAFYAIQKFLGFSNSAQAGQFTSSLQLDVDRIWRGSQATENKDYNLPTKVKYICFADYSPTANKKGENEDFYDELNQAFFGDENLFFYPPGSGEGFDSVKIKHIDLEKITENENPLCFPNVKGKISLTIKKDFNEALVSIEK